MMIRPARSISGRVTLPGDKSISHRAAMLSAIAVGNTKIRNFALSADCRSTLSCLRALGVGIDQAGSTLAVRGVGKNGLRRPVSVLDCGNSGTTMRLLAGILAGQKFDSILSGDASLSSRPMRRIIEPLGSMGASIGSNDGSAPLEIIGGRPLRGITFEPEVSSAQVKSCVLLAGLYASGETSIAEKVPTRDHTERMLEFMGGGISIDAANGATRIAVSNSGELRAADIDIPGDISSAAFFAVAAACLPGSDIIIEGVGLNPTRTAVLDVLARCGAAIQVFGEHRVANEPAGSVRITGSSSTSADGNANLVSGPIVANLIDEIPTLAVYGTRLKNGIEIRDARELRVKESDRIASVVENLKRMGANVEEYNDGMRIGRSELKGSTVDAFGDHRIAMAFAVAALMAEGHTEIREAECVDVSFPGFFDELEKLVQR